MRILAIETSCDETAIALADFLGKRTKPRLNILSNIISSQTKLHAKFGGVVPNLAKREHQRNLIPILLSALRGTAVRNYKLQITNYKKIPKPKIQKIEKVLEREQELLEQFKKYVVPVRPPKIDALAVTYGPGLAPALWVGVNFARALAYLWGRPLIPVNHMAGHAYSALLQKEKSKWQIANIKFPAMALLVSGGHTELVLMRGYGKYKILGETLDDAAGEAFDKVGRLLGLKYPGGPEISKLAKKGDHRKYPLPSPMINSSNYDFSFSGLKTAVLYLLRDVTGLAYHKRQAKLTTETKANVAASFQKAVIDVLVKKTIRAAQEYKIKTVLLGGGVAANKLLRKRLVEEIRKQLPLISYQLPAASLTGDNALMIAVAAYFSGKKKAWNKIRADANLRLS